MQGALNRICLYRASSILNGPNYANGIVFGGRVLKQFYAAFDMSATSKVNRNKEWSRINARSTIECDSVHRHQLTYSRVACCALCSDRSREQGGVCE
jgi:hypothetical protein